MKKLLLLLLLSPTFAFAQEDWEYVGTSTKQDEFYIRRVAKKDNYGKITFWIKMQKPEKIEKSESSVYKSGDYSVTKYEGNCSEMTLRILGGILYNKKGDSKVTLVENYDSDIAMPDSIAETFLDVACKKIIE